VFSEIDGKINIITFEDTAAAILHDSYVQSTEDDTDNTMQSLKHVAKAIRSEMLASNSQFPSEFYPPPSDIDIANLEKQIPTYLLMLIRSIVLGSSNSKRVTVISICHAIMQASQGLTFISPLQLTTGLFIHQTTRSRTIIDVLFSLGFCSSYDHVINFERSATVSTLASDIPSALLKLSDGGGVCQWVADNFDYNEDSLTGHDSTHVMGIIACQVKTSDDQTCYSPLIKRGRAATADILSCGTFTKMIMPYKQPVRSKLADVVFEPICAVNMPTSVFHHLDNLWLISSKLDTMAANWQGFMTQAVTGVSVCSTVVYNPMVPLNPTTCEAVYSTMTFVMKQAVAIGQHCAVITFDQPLYLKSYMIKQD